MNTQQIEMSFGALQAGRKSGAVQYQRRSHARWWFGQMRLVVESAIDWKSAPPPPPEQTHLTLVPGK
jgi:hypothetical protein